MKKFSGLVISIILALSLSACSLAVKDQVVIKSNDKLIGIYVTTEYIDTYDWDNITMGSDGNIVFDQMNNGKIYGTLDKENHTIDFGDIPGYELILLAEEDDMGTVTSVIGDDVMYNIAINISDSEYEISGTIGYDETQLALYDYYEDDTCYDRYDKEDINVLTNEDGTTSYEVVTPGEVISFYANPVYETFEGQVYLVSGTGQMSSGSSIEMSTCISDSTKTTMNGNTITKEMKVTLKMEPVVPVSKVTFSQIDSQGQVISHDSYEIEEFQTSYTWADNTEYIVVELINKKGSTTWDIINKKDGATYGINISSDNLICQPQNIELLNLGLDF